MKRPWLLPLTPLWAAGTAWKNRRFNRGSAPVERLHLPVISIGSLSAGGAGKTPFVMALGDALRRADVGFDVLSRGYGRTVDTDAAKRVAANGTADEFGDEPLLMARGLGRRVYVAKERAEAGRMAERDYHHRHESGPWVHLLDDGFQHRRLARAVDIVLLTQADVEDTLLPAGDLREPLQSLQRADVIVLRNDEATTLRPVVEDILRTARKQPLVWQMERIFRFTEGTPSSAPLAFCGIARPENFRHAFARHGVACADFLPLRDHQRYDGKTVQRVMEAARRSQANGFVTTAKDAVKLSPGLRAKMLRIGPIAVADITVRLIDEDRSIPELLRQLSEASGSVQ